MILHYSIPPDLPKRFKIEANTIVVGRRAKGDSFIDLDLESDEYVSHLHARITCENDAYWIEDLDSSNGTFVHDQIITSKTRLLPGTKVKVGMTIIEVIVEPEATDRDSSPDSDGQGTIINLEDVITSFTTTDGGVVDKKAAKDWRQLKAFNDFCQNIATAADLNSLGKILVEQLQKAMPSAQRGAILLPDKRGELLLKVHWPPGDHSVSTTWVKRAYSNKEAFIWQAVIDCDVETTTPNSAIYYRVQSALYVPLISGEQALGVIYVDNYLTREAFSPVDLELLRAIANQVAIFVRDRILRQDLKREEAIQTNLSRQFSLRVAQRIMEKYDGLRMGGERADPVTILVSDVRNFTTLSAKMEPDDVVRMLNEMFDAFVPIIFECNGVVDKYVGDSVLAIFGSPEKDDRQWENAIQAAMEMQVAIRKLGEGRKVRRLLEFQVGIGIHSGAVIHGFIGSSKRLEYTVIGDTVNLAARHCEGAGPGEVVISKSVYERVYHLVEVIPKKILTKHPNAEPVLEAFIVEGLKNKH